MGVSSGVAKKVFFQGVFLRAVCCSGAPAGTCAPPSPPVPAVAAGSKTCCTAPGRDAAGCCGICAFSSSFLRCPNPGGSGHVKGALAHRAERGLPLTWPRQDYIARLEEEEKAPLQSAAACGCQGPATAMFPAATAGGEGKEHAPAPGARPHTAQQSKTNRPTTERSDLRGGWGHVAPTLSASPRPPAFAGCQTTVAVLLVRAAHLVRAGGGSPDGGQRVSGQRYTSHQDHLPRRQRSAHTPVPGVASRSAAESLALTQEPCGSTVRALQGGRKAAEGQVQAEQPRSPEREDSPAFGGRPGRRGEPPQESAGAAKPLTSRSGCDWPSPHRGMGGERKRWHGQSAAAPVLTAVPPEGRRSGQRRSVQWSAFAPTRGAGTSPGSPAGRGGSPAATPHQPLH